MKTHSPRRRPSIRSCLRTVMFSPFSYLEIATAVLQSRTAACLCVENFVGTGIIRKYVFRYSISLAIAIRCLLQSGRGDGSAAESCASRGRVGFAIGRRVGGAGRGRVRLCAVPRQQSALLRGTRQAHAQTAAATHDTRGGPLQVPYASFHSSIAALICNFDNTVSFH